MSAKNKRSRKELNDNGMWQIFYEAEQLYNAQPDIQLHL
jgi:hypothetical protein